MRPTPRRADGPPLGDTLGRWRTARASGTGAGWVAACANAAAPYRRASSPQARSRRNKGDRMSLDDLKERSKAIDIAVGQIEKQFGKGAIMRLGQRNQLG